MASISNGKYKSWTYYKYDKDFRQNFELEKINSDSNNWRIFYKGQNSNWICFYPFSEYHGGGQPYIINIGESDFDNWILNNNSFESEIRKQIEDE